MQAVILAGGKGTRLRPLTLTTPKPILPVCNRPFLTYQIELLKRAGIEDIILSLNYQPSKIRNILKNGEDLGVNLKYVVEPEPMGTAGAFKYAEKFIYGTTVVLNGDSYIDFNLKSAIKEHISRDAVSTIVLTEVADTTSYGLVETFPDGKIKSFLEKSSIKYSSSNTINAGVYILDNAILNLIPENKYFMFEKNVFPMLLQEENLNFYSHMPKTSYWIDIGSPQNYLKANMDFLIKQIKPHHKKEHNKREHRNYEQSIIGENTQIKDGVQLKNAVIGNNCFIGEGVRITNTVILPYSSILSNSELNSSVIGENCTIGQFCLLKNTILSEKSIVNNYTSFSGDEVSS